MLHRGDCSDINFQSKGYKINTGLKSVGAKATTAATVLTPLM